MSGYFARLLSRAQRATPAVRPQTALGFSAPPFVDGSLEPQLAEASAAPVLEAPTTGEHHVRAERSVRDPESHRDAQDDEHIASPISFTSPLLAHDEHRARPVTVHADAISRARDEESDDDVGKPTSPRRASNDDAPRRVPSASPSAEAKGTPRSDADFRLMPIPPVTKSDRAASNGMESAAFARAVEDARAQIQRQLASQGGAPSEVHVTIGRIEVTAAPSAPSAPRKAPDRAPTVTLEQYLATRARQRS